MVGEDHFDAPFVEQVKRYKYRGSSWESEFGARTASRISPAVPGDGVHVRGDIAIAPFAGIFPGARVRRRQVRRLLEAALSQRGGSFAGPHPSALAPPGKHVMSIFVQYAPLQPKEGADTWPQRREEFGDTVVDTLSEYCPGLKDSILHRQVLTPWDLEHEIGLTEG